MEEQIFKIISEHQPIKAKDIAALIPGADKKDVNSYLYGDLSSKVSQGSDYKWSVSKNPSTRTSGKNGQESKKQDTVLAKLASYYFDCISRDLDTGISEYATSNFGRPNYELLGDLPDEDGVELDPEEIKHLKTKLWKEKGALTVNIGYPLFVEKHRSKKGSTYFTVKPLLIHRLDKDDFNKAKLSLSDESLLINPEAFRKLDGSSPSEMLSEMLQLSSELGLDQDETPDLDEVAQRLQNIRSDWDWKERIDSKLNILDFSNIDQGIYNAGGIFLSEKSKYTVGLEHELDQLTKIPHSDYRSTALDEWLTYDITEVETVDKTLIEPLPLNEEQREAVIKGLQQNLSVVTGPPGTGKSQVVTSLIANAVYDGQKVLFASKNNKAVDVVLDRVNGLTKQPVMLRLGGQSGQGELASFLTGIISSSPDRTVEDRFRERENAHSRFAEKVKSINSELEKYVDLRNQIDQSEFSLEEIKLELGESNYSRLKILNLNKRRSAIDTSLSGLAEAINDAQKENHNFINRIFWFTIEKQKHKALSKAVHAVKKTAAGLFPDQSLDYPVHDDSIVNIAKTLLQKVKSRTKLVKDIQHYYEQLSQLSNQDDIFNLTKKESKLKDHISKNSIELWQLWLELLPNRLDQNDKRQIGDYITILNLISSSLKEDESVSKKTWAQYYQLQSKVTNILSCWGVTSLSVKGKIPFEPGYFDLVVIDEASQCDIASAIPLLYRAKRVVIIGDDKQLTHISSINKKQDIQLLERHKLIETHMSWSYAGSSLFKLAASLCHQGDITVLRDHHRSHADIIGYSNKHFYNGQLRVATDYSRLKYTSESAVRWVDVKGQVSRPFQGGALNETEAKAVVKELKRLVDTNYEGTIGVVTPFRGQANMIRDLIHNDSALSNALLSREFLVDTVHKFQGDERDTMIFSSVISNGISEGSEGFLARTGNLFNVAITRARAALIIVGDMKACQNSRASHFSDFAKYVLELGKTQDRKNIKIEYSAKYPEVSSTEIYSEWEVLLYEALYEHGIRTQVQYKVDKYSLDLALIIGDHKLDIEVDGETYHRNWDGELLRRDKLRNKRLIELGWDVQRFWVYQIREDLQGCIDKIRKWQLEKTG
jgi:very-short-patch-repair endonuclease